MSVVPIKSLFNHLCYQWSVILSRLGVEYTCPMPVFLSIEPSAICQLHCPECPCGTDNNRPLNANRMMSLDTFQTILNQCRGWVHTMQFYFQGEPLLNPHLCQMIHLAHKAHIYTTCSTNAQALTPLLAEQLVKAGLDRIIVSVDGLSEETYQAYRQGGSLNQALYGLICLRNAKEQMGGHTHIELQCLALKTNELQWDMMQRSYRQMGADSFTLKTAQFIDYVHGNPLMPANKQYCRYQKMADGSYLPKNRLHNMTNLPCHRILSGCVITVNGDVLPCCFDKSAHYSMGNIHTSSLRQIWHNKSFMSFRQHIKHNRMDTPMCCNCTEN